MALTMPLSQRSVRQQANHILPERLGDFEQSYSKEEAQAIYRRNSIVSAEEIYENTAPRCQFSKRKGCDIPRLWYERIGTHKHVTCTEKASYLCNKEELAKMGFTMASSIQQPVNVSNEISRTLWIVQGYSCLEHFYWLSFIHFSFQPRAVSLSVIVGCMRWKVEYSQSISVKARLLVWSLSNEEQRGFA